MPDVLRGAGWRRGEGRVRRLRDPATVLALLLGAGAVLSLLALADIALYLQGRAASKLAALPRATTLMVLLPVLAVLAASFAVGARQTWRADSAQRAAAGSWSTGSILLWGVLLWYVWMVNSPVPPLTHHTDKFLVLCLLLLAVGLALNVRPGAVARLVATRPARWLRVLAVNAVVFALVGEALFRLADPLLARSGLFGDKHTPAHLKPHAPVQGSIGVSNSQGFRDRERTMERRGPGPRVVALGDSFTWGAGVSYDQTFTTLVEQTLKTEWPGLEVINLGVGGWGPHEELHLLESYGVRLDPDLVLLDFYVGNDIQNKRGDDGNLTKILLVAGQSYYVHSNGHLVHDTLGPDRWYLYHDLNYLWRVGTARILARAEAGSMADRGPGLVPRSAYLRGIHERSDIYLARDTDYFQGHWARTRATLSAIRSLLGQRHIPLVLVLIPDQVQFDPDLQNEYLGAFASSEERYDFGKPQRLLNAWAREEGVQVIDLLPVFRAMGTPGDLHFRNDIHWNEAGHALAAEAIAPVLRRQLQSRFAVKREGP